MSSLTLEDIWHIAEINVPVVARYEDRISWRYSWGPAHELGHALVATAKERTQPNFGLTCESGMCRCPNEYCHVVELAAMDVSHRLVIAAGQTHLVRVEIKVTLNYDMMARSETRAAAQCLIKQRGLRRLPHTATGLTKLVRERMKEIP